jgi:hypothetical protein
MAEYFVTDDPNRRRFGATRVTDDPNRRRFGATRDQDGNLQPTPVSPRQKGFGEGLTPARDWQKNFQPRGFVAAAAPVQYGPESIPNQIAMATRQSRKGSTVFGQPTSPAPAVGGSPGAGASGGRGFLNSPAPAVGGSPGAGASGGRGFLNVAGIGTGAVAAMERNVAGIGTGAVAAMERKVPGYSKMTPAQRRAALQAAHDPAMEVGTVIGKTQIAGSDYGEPDAKYLDAAATAELKKPRVVARGGFVPPDAKPAAVRAASPDSMRNLPKPAPITADNMRMRNGDYGVPPSPPLNGKPENAGGFVAPATAERGAASPLAAVSAAARGLAAKVKGFVPPTVLAAVTAPAELSPVEKALSPVALHPALARMKKAGNVVKATARAGVERYQAQTREARGLFRRARTAVDEARRANTPTLSGFLRALREARKQKPTGQVAAY